MADTGGPYDEAGSSDQQQLINHMTEMFGMPADTARDLLERCNNNLEVAVQEYMNFEEGRPMNVLSQRERDDQESLLRRRQFHADGEIQEAGSSNVTARPRYAVIQQQTWSDWIYGILTMPFNFVYYTLASLIEFLFSVFFGGGRQRAIGELANTDRDVRAFNEKFDAKYGENHIPFHVVSYKQLMQDVKQDLRYALVYIHSWIHEDSDEFCQQTLTSANFRNFMEENNMLFWAVDAQSSLGSKVSAAMRQTSYPSVSLVCVREGRPAVVWRMNGLPNGYSAFYLVQQLQQAIEDSGAYLIAERAQRAQVQADARLRQEQQEAYAATLERDREIMRQREENERRQREEQERREKEELQLAHRATREGAFRALIMGNIPSETGSCRVGVTLPGGKRLVMKFEETDTLEELYRRCLANEQCPLNMSLWRAHPREQLDYIPNWLSSLTWLDDSSDLNNLLSDVEKSAPNISSLHGQMIYVLDEEA